MGEEGYFTVEAALVLPMVLMEAVLVIYLLMFQYDRCLMEQDTGILAFRGMVAQGDAREKVEGLAEQAAEQDKGKYIAWEMDDARLKLNRGKLHIERSGRLAFPFYHMVGNVDAVWRAGAVYENHVASPVVFVRSWRKMTGGK